MPGPVFIDGDRIALRTIEAEDAEFIGRITEPAVRRYIPIIRTPFNRESWEEYIEEVNDNESIVSLLVCLDGDPLGEVMYRPIRRDNGTAELGLWLVPEAWGEGYGTEATELLVEYGFDALRLHRITARPVSVNARSRELLSHLGFSHEGTHREALFVAGEYLDEECYALLETEWRD